MKTKYSIVKQSIKSKILDGTYKPNQKIKSESELMEIFGVSRHTVRLAIGDLVTEGWLYREQGSGTFCADREKNGSQISHARNKEIAIIATYISDYIFPSIIRGAEEYLSKNGYQVSIFSTNNDHENEKRVLEKILTQNFDGVIIEPTKSAISNPNINYYLNLENQKIPYIMINAYYDELEPLSVTMNDEKGSYLLTEHLINLGHNNIVGFFKTDDNQGSKRMKGYLKAHRDLGKSINPANIVTYRSDEKNKKPVEEFSRILSSTSERPTGIVCYNDELAVKLLDVIREQKLTVPEDISIVGFDNSFLAEVTEVKLTTIEHPKSEMGKVAAKLILDLINEKKGLNKEKDKAQSVVYEPEVIIRSSTRKIN
ncbi:GntR family transcriptional regulator [Oceanobacillus chungangensis]|uniref:GntR family transcriptional regulator n=1 Tax=Oceanobacillus chungangensis TaxID=1229152 RepID=A0A3D8PZC4_9BACI|nr:GntR family transcriptional regulator [Oceanobacillus chungangensis]RDW20701.1 GntR family transcriptional regulator [Oceanobacillus chungangensis]